MEEVLHHGEILKRMISESQFSQKEIADKIGINNSNLIRLLGRSWLRTDQLAEIMEILGKHPGELWSSYDQSIKIEYEALKNDHLALQKKVIELQDELLKINK